MDLNPGHEPGKTTFRAPPSKGFPCTKFDFLFVGLARTHYTWKESLEPRNANSAGHWPGTEKANYWPGPGRNWALGPSGYR